MMNSVWLRVRTDAGIDGWGEAFGHGTSEAMMAVLDKQLAPAVLGKDARDIAGLRQALGKAFHLYGRNGLHVLAGTRSAMTRWGGA